MSPREIAEHAADSHYLDEPEADERDAFIAGYLRARADVEATNAAVERLLTIAGEP
jgi:hypothetical protein